MFLPVSWCYKSHVNAQYPLLFSNYNNKKNSPCREKGQQSGLYRICLCCLDLSLVGDLGSRFTYASTYSNLWLLFPYPFLFIVVFVGV